MKNLFQSTFNLQETLSKSGIQSCVIGGLAVAIWGEPRLTRDADLKILLTRNHSEELLNILKKKLHFFGSKPFGYFIKVWFYFHKRSERYSIRSTSCRYTL